MVPFKSACEEILVKEKLYVKHQTPMQIKKMYDSFAGEQVLMWYCISKQGWDGCLARHWGWCGAGNLAALSACASMMTSADSKHSMQTLTDI